MTMTQTPGWFPDPAGGPGQRWWDGHQWTAQTQPAPTVSPVKEKRIWLRVLVALGVLFLLGVGGCTALLAVGGNALDDAADDLKTDQSARQVEIAKDVTLGLCAADDLGFLAASGTITNNSSERSNYTVSVVFLEKDGRQVGEGFATVGNVDPGRKADWSASSFQRLTFTECKVAEVSRYSDEP